MNHKLWNGSMIVGPNPELPDHLVVQVHRVDVRHDCMLAGDAERDPYEGNLGMGDAAKSTPYSIAYISINYKNATEEAKLGEAALENCDGNFMMPDSKSVQAVVKVTTSKTRRASKSA